MLKTIASACASASKGVGSAGRIGGEEFAVLLPNFSIEAAATFAEDLRRRIAGTPTPMGLDAHIPVTVSIGVAALGNDVDLGKLIQAADLALYAAKKQGRNRVVCADNSTFAEPEVKLIRADSVGGQFP